MDDNVNRPDAIDPASILDELVASERQQSNCMFQLSLMLARISLEPVSENFKDQTAQAILGLIRSKPKSNVMKFFGAPHSTEVEAPGIGAKAEPR